VREQFFLGIPKAFAKTFNLPKRFLAVACRGEKRRRPVEAVGPDLGMIEDVLESAIGGAGRFVKNPLEQTVDRLLNFGVVRDLAGQPVSSAAHSGVSGTTLDNDSKAAIRNALNDGGLCEANQVVDLPCFEKSLGESSLFPISPLHGECRGGKFVNAVSIVRGKIERRNFCGIAEREAGAEHSRGAKELSAMHGETSKRIWRQATTEGREPAVTEGKGIYNNLQKEN